MPETPSETATADARLEPVLRLARSCRYEAEHTHQVAQLALRLFDELQPVHRLGDEERFLLECGALLHDIGWVEGWKGHHKTALRIILNTPILPFETRERYLVGSIARYHRRALPDEKHDHFATLNPADRANLRVLAGILRVADGLDRTHRAVVQDLECRVTPRRVTITCAVNGHADDERTAALATGKLLAEALGRRLEIELRPINEYS